MTDDRCTGGCRSSSPSPPRRLEGVRFFYAARGTRHSALHTPLSGHATDDGLPTLKSSGVFCCICHGSTPLLYQQYKYAHRVYRTERVCVTLCMNIKNDSSCSTSAAQSSIVVRVKTMCSTSPRAALVCVRASGPQAAAFYQKETIDAWPGFTLNISTDDKDPSERA
ncbi:hypothetical protein QTP88_012927 [Uroleucon formosanum]